MLEWLYKAGMILKTLIFVRAVQFLIIFPSSLQLPTITGTFAANPSLTASWNTLKIIFNLALKTNKITYLRT